jgi:hypothetical protein
MLTNQCLPLISLLVVTSWAEFTGFIIFTIISIHPTQCQSPMNMQNNFCVCTRVFPSLDRNWKLSFLSLRFLLSSCQPFVCFSLRLPLWSAPRSFLPSRASHYITPFPYSRYWCDRHLSCLLLCCRCCSNHPPTFHRDWNRSRYCHSSPTCLRRGTSRLSRGPSTWLCCSTLWTTRSLHFRPTFLRFSRLWRQPLRKQHRHHHLPPSLLNSHWLLICRIFECPSCETEDTNEHVFSPAPIFIFCLLALFSTLWGLKCEKKWICLSFNIAICNIFFMV